LSAFCPFLLHALTHFLEVGMFGDVGPEIDFGLRNSVRDTLKNRANSGGCASHPSFAEATENFAVGPLGCSVEQACLSGVWAAITTTSFTNHYEWGDLKANPSKLLEKYFDAFVYVANWGTHEFYSTGTAYPRPA
jgi:hypothetical protein